MTIRLANFSDLAPLAALFDAYRVFYGKTSDLSAATDFLSQRLERQESVVFAAFSPEEIMLGFTQLYPLFSSTRMKRLWLLNDLFVREEFRGKGISVQLIDAAKAHCIETGACALTLETSKSNIIGNQLYPRAGFTLDTDHNYYEWEVV
ncbi:MAG: GNAT family N-acetyltransferase [Bacteroidetes bacterium]|nr:MAG: GNAT family N-acetyltransferase [Bacteroidota bacterium]